jgi:hypothetical protein
MAKQQSNKEKKTLQRLQCISSFFQNGLNRMITVMGNEAFSFIVNGRQFESTNQSVSSEHYDGVQQFVDVVALHPTGENRSGGGHFGPIQS